MPRIKRFHPIAHDFNRDPEVRELRRRFADWMGYAWQEMLSISDRNQGIIKGDTRSIAESLAHVSLSTRPQHAVKKILTAIPYMADKGWIEVHQDHVRVCNYAEYHPRREQASSLLPSLPPSKPPKDKEKTKDVSPELAPNIRGWLEQTQHMQSLSNGKHRDYWQALERAYDSYEWLYFEEEIKKADAWMAANPKRKPTPGGMPRFFRSWLERAVERGRKVHG